MLLAQSRRLSVSLALLALAGCVDLTGVRDTFGARLVAIDLWSEGSTTALVEVGDTVRVSTFGRTDGVLGILTYDRVLDAVWRTADASVARARSLSKPPRGDSTTPAQAIVEGVRPGTTSVSASARGVVGTIAVRVVPPIARIELRSPRDTMFVGDTVTIAVSPLDAAGTPMRDVPIRFGIDSGLVMTDGWGTDFVRVVGVAAGRAFVTARFRRATGRVDLVVARRGT